MATRRRWSPSAASARSATPTSSAALITEAIEANPKACDDFRAGREAALQSLVGHVMKATRGRADARLVTTLLREQLSG